MSARTGRTSEKEKAAFIAALQEGATVGEACKLVGVGRSTVYDHRQQDEAFALAWADAVETGVDELVGEARRRALAKSDILLMFLIKAARPEYRDSVKVEQTTTIRDDRIRRAAQADPELMERVSRMLAEAETGQ